MERPGETMTNRPATPRLQRDIHFIWKALKRKRLAAVACYLFYLHKNDIQYWVIVHRELMTTSLNHSELDDVAKVITASKASTLSEAADYIPGILPNTVASPEPPVE